MAGFKLPDSAFVPGLLAQTQRQKQAGAMASGIDPRTVSARGVDYADKMGDAFDGRVLTPEGFAQHQQLVEEANRIAQEQGITTAAAMTALIFGGAALMGSGATGAAGTTGASGAGAAGAAEGAGAVGGGAVGGGSATAGNLGFSGSMAMPELGASMPAGVTGFSSAIPTAAPAAGSWMPAAGAGTLGGATAIGTGAQIGAGTAAEGAATMGGGGLMGTVKDAAGTAGSFLKDNPMLTQIGGAALGALAGQDQTQSSSNTKDPWGPAQPYLLDNLKTNSNAQEYYRTNPFSDLQKQQYQGLFNSLANSQANVPGLLANAGNFSKSSRGQMPAMIGLLSGTQAPAIDWAQYQNIGRK